MTSLGADLRSDGEALAEAMAVARETMVRARRNVERLIKQLPSFGFEFESNPLAPPPPDAAQWDRGTTFEVPVAPDYLHKANVSGGMPYGLAVPNPAADGLLLWEPHQTTFVNYLRIAFRMGGMPGWQREPALLEEWALPQDSPPKWLLDLGNQLLPI